MKMYLCRHGETEWSLSGQHTGVTDIPLTQKGERQAELLRKRIEGVSFDAIFTSPLLRAKMTSPKKDIIIDPNLSEWNYGDYEGVTSDQIQKENPGWNLFMNGAPNGESIADVQKRADAFLKRVAEYKGNIAVFSHGHFLRVLAARYLLLPAKDGKIFSLSVASLCILGQEHKMPVISLWNDTHHLASLE